LIFKFKRYILCNNIAAIYLVEIRFGASQNDGKGQIEDECRETDDTQTEETSPANRRFLCHFGVVNDSVGSGEFFRRFVIAETF
jgi:hypothetical protein